MQNITTFLTFKDNGEQAVNFYVSVFKHSKVLSSMQMGGKLLHAVFELNGQQFMAMDGGEIFSFALGTSLFVNCETQEEVDELWDKLSAGGEKGKCGWLKDKYGLSWQIIPKALGELMMEIKRAFPDLEAWVLATPQEEIDRRILEVWRASV